MCCVQFQCHVGKHLPRGEHWGSAKYHTFVFPPLRANGVPLPRRDKCDKQTISGITGAEGEVEQRSICKNNEGFQNLRGAGDANDDVCNDPSRCPTSGHSTVIVFYLYLQLSILFFLLGSI